MDKLFVYGIFLDAVNRNNYGMTKPRYATVRDYATWGDHVVTAYKHKDAGLALTGLVVEMPRFIMGRSGLIDNWKALDNLERGYKRVRITTIQGEKAYMYVGKVSDDKGAKAGRDTSHQQSQKE